MLNQGMLTDFVAAFDEIQANDAIRGAVLISGKPKSFIAGADIR